MAGSATSSRVLPLTISQCIDAVARTLEGRRPTIVHVCRRCHADDTMRTEGSGSLAVVSDLTRTILV